MGLADCTGRSRAKSSNDCGLTRLYPAPSFPRMTRIHQALLVLATLGALGACSDPNQLGSAGLENQLDTAVTIWSLRTGPLNQPTAYSLEIRRGIRIWDGGVGFDFAYSTDTLGRSLALPRQVLGLATGATVNPGLKPSALTFDQMTKADLNGYITNDTVELHVGDRYFVRTNTNACPALGVPIYGKIEILDIDTAAATLKFRAIADQNCGYRGLNLGIPKQ